MSTITGQFYLARKDFLLDVSFTLPGTGVSAIFGSSGSGKTSLLRCIAGLERTQGQLQVAEKMWQSDRFFMPTHKRPLAYVFQEASLFPHLTVRQNLLYGLNRIHKTKRKISLEQVIAWLSLEKLIERKDPLQLSGGERQRVAIGRALLTSPELLLMDEPLAALDHHSKQEIFPYLEQLHRQLNIPILYVSHALDEVVRLADQILLLEQGKVLACGKLAETLSRLDLPLAHYLDASSVIEATLTEHDEVYHLSKVSFHGGDLWLSRINLPLGSPVRARILARDVSLSLIHAQYSSINNILAAQIIEICDEGPDKVNVKLQISPNQFLIARITRRSQNILSLHAGMTLFAQIKSVALM